MKISQLLTALILISLLISGITYSNKADYSDSLPIAQRLDRSPLSITNGFRRGITYIDFNGPEYNLRYIPIVLSNDTSFPINVHLKFQASYSHEPRAGTEETFQLVALPREWALDGVGITEETLNLLPEHIEQAELNIELQAGENYLFAIGTIYAKNPQCGIIPSELFVIDESQEFENCMDNPSSNMDSVAQIKLGLKLDYCSDGCMLIACGDVSF